MHKELEAIEAVARAVDRIERRGRYADFTLQNGIVLAMRPIPPLLLQAVSDEFRAPDPPTIWLEDRERHEPNPNDPAYLKEIQRITEAEQLATEDLTLAVGTSVKHVPEGMFKPEDDGWVTQVKFAAKLGKLDIEIDTEDEVKRYLAWLRFYALESSTDIVMVRNLSTMLAGIQEGEVDEVIESFRGDPRRGTDSQSASETGGQDGDNRAARRRRSRS